MEREGGTIGDVAVTFICSYSLNGVVVPGILTSDRPQQVVLRDGESQATVSVEIDTSSFLSIGASFDVLIDEVKLLTGKCMDRSTHILYRSVYLIVLWEAP